MAAPGQQPVIVQQRINTFLQLWQTLPTNLNVANRLTLAYLGGLFDAEGTASTKCSPDKRWRSRHARVDFWQSNVAFHNLVRNSAPFAGKRYETLTRPSNGIYSHGCTATGARYVGSAAANIAAALEPFMVKKSYVARLVVEWEQTPKWQRTWQQYQDICQLQRAHIYIQDWQQAGAPSAHSYFPRTRLAATFSDLELKQYVAGLFDGDGCVSIQLEGSNSSGFDRLCLWACISQKGCPELLEAVRGALGYGRLYSGGCELRFAGNDVQRFWDEVVEPHCVLRVHKYATMFKLCFNGATRASVSPALGPEPGPYRNGLRVNCKWDGHPDQDGINWSRALRQWTNNNAVKPLWAT